MSRRRRRREVLRLPEAPSSIVDASVHFLVFPSLSGSLFFFFFFFFFSSFFGVAKVPPLLVSTVNNGSVTVSLVSFVSSILVDESFGFAAAGWLSVNRPNLFYLVDTTSFR